jgi:O-antigen/teichoic acid export membrane protein
MLYFKLRKERTCKLIGNKITVWAFSSNIFKLLSQWIILMSITKLCQLEIVGIYTYSMAISSPVFIFMGLQLRNIQVVDVKNEYPFKAYLYTRLFYILISIFILICISFFILSSQNEYIIYYMVIIIKAQEQYIDIIYGYYQKELRMDLMGKSMIIKSIIDSIIFICLILNNRFLSLCFILSILTNYLIYYHYDKKKLFHIFNKSTNIHLKNEKIHILNEYIKPLSKKSYMLGLSVLLTSLTTNIPRYFIKYFLGYNILGIYGGISYITTAFFSLLTPLQLILRPKLAIAYNTNINKFQILKKYGYMLYIFLGIIAIVGIMCFGEEILGIFFTEEFQNYKFLFLIIFISSLLQSISSINNLSLQAKQIFNKQVYISLINIVICFVLSYVLIINYGMNGLFCILSITGMLTFFIYQYLDEKYK